MMKNQWKAFLIAFIVIGTVFSCKNSEKEERNNADRKELVLAFGDEPDDGFDPTRGWGAYGSPLFQSTLFKYDKDFNVKNDLATDYEMSEDGLVWKVTLREDVVFSDDTPLTAKDVVFTFTKAKDSQSAIDLTNLENVEQNGDYDVVFNLKKGNSAFMTYLATLGIVPEHAYDKDYGENPIGSGSYKLIKWDKGQQIIVEKNEKYYGKQPYFEKVTFVILSESAAFAAAQAGKVDMVSISPALANHKVKGMKLEKLASVDNRGLALPVGPDEGKTKNGAPIGNDVTSDPAIRKAMNIGVNRQELIENVLNGYGTPAYTIADNLPWWNEDTVIDDADLDGAKQLLEEAGWKENEKGIREKDGVKAEFTVFYSSNDDVRQALAIAFADMMKPLGISVKTKGTSWGEIEKNMFSNPVVFGLGSHSPLELYNAFSVNRQGSGLSNPNFYENETVEDYLDKALAATTQEEAYDYWKKAQWDGETGFTFKGDAAWVWLVNLDHLFLVNEDLEIGPQKLQPHQHNWPVTDFIENWHWKN